MAMIVIIDYGMGNVGSIRNMLKKAGAQSIVSSDADAISRADAIILPGVGAFDTGMRRLAELDLISVLNRRVIERRTPILGICLGMQLLTNRSEEGSLPGLGWINGETIRFFRDEVEPELRVPHMGWNYVQPAKDHFLFEGLEKPRFYFVHSYHVQCERTTVLATCNYGRDFTAAVHRGNIMGTQFHPEKSHRFGLTLLRSFLRQIHNVQSPSDALSAA